MKSTNWLKLRPPDRVKFQRNILWHSCLQNASRVWPRCWDVLDDVNSSLVTFKFELQTLNTSQLGGQTLAAFSTVLPPIILRYVVIRWSELNPYSPGCPFVSPQTSSEFESKMALAWWKYACSPKYALSTGYSVYGCWIKLRHVPRSLFTKSAFFNNQRHQFATANEFHHEKQTILKKNCYNPFDALI